MLFTLHLPPIRHKEDQSVQVTHVSCLQYVSCRPCAPGDRPGAKTCVQTVRGDLNVSETCEEVKQLFNDAWRDGLYCLIPRSAEI